MNLLFNNRFFLPVFFFILLHPVSYTSAEDGYRLWLRYDQISDTAILRKYKSLVSEIIIDGNHPTLAAAKNEMKNAIEGLLGIKVQFVKKIKRNGTIIAGTPESSKIIASLKLDDKLTKTVNDGFIIYTTKIVDKSCIIITGHTEIGVLYGVFHFIRLLQTHQSINNLLIISNPKIKFRILDHWDNLNGTVERGYAGNSLWDWTNLPDSISQRYIDYARENASIGINGTVLNNVNANAEILTDYYLLKVAVIARVFRQYGIKVYLSARFSAPIEIGGLQTADPLDKQVIEWWKNKVDEIYTLIPDFGGFLVKANSEGQPGPQKYGRTHEDGADLLASTLAPHNGIVMWRAFVYDNNIDEDRAKQAYNEFKPLDGKFDSNVFIQVKNGPIDFQPREPFHPLFGAMPNTPLMMEFQITKEYLGFATHLVYLAPLFKECLNSDTYEKGAGSTVARIIDGTLENHTFSGIAGVSNIGSDRNWCGSHFAQANWYAFGRIAWDYSLTSEEIADEWIRMTFSNDEQFISQVKKMMMASREIAVDYMTPIGLHHIMAKDSHYGPGPWVNEGRPDWTSVYYHRADTIGLGFDRTSRGSNSISQYFQPVRNKFENLDSCPENLLLWFHHIDWNYRMESGRSLWEELCYKYYNGVDSVRWMQNTWDSLDGKIDKERFEQIKSNLDIQEKEAVWWRNACLLYFQTYSKLPIPDGYEKPAETLEYYVKNKHL